MLNVRKIADIAQKMFNFPFFSPRMLFLSPLSLSLSLPGSYFFLNGASCSTRSFSIGIIIARMAWLSAYLVLSAWLCIRSFSYYFFCQNDFIIHLIHFCTNVERFMPE